MVNILSMFLIVMGAITSLAMVFAIIDSWLFNGATVNRMVDKIFGDKNGKR